jgi:hypothetical protein
MNNAEIVIELNALDIAVEKRIPPNIVVTARGIANRSASTPRLVLVAMSSDQQSYLYELRAIHGPQRVTTHVSATDIITDVLVEQVFVTVRSQTNELRESIAIRHQLS